jgi:general secretion pathway protein B
MSYILEALKKAEQSRLAASPPDLTRVALSAEEPVRAPRTRFSGLLLAAAVTGATAFGWWLSVQSAAKPGIEKLAAFVLPSRQAAQVAEASAQNPQDTHGTVQAKRLPAPTSRASAITDERELDIPPKAPWVKPAALTINPEKTANKAGSLKQKDLADPSGSSGLVAPEALSSDATKKQITALAVDVPVLKPDRGLRVFRLEELPPELRRELPKLSATGYVDSAEAGGRVVSINERSLREGDELIAGMKLELITPDYVLFRFHGYRFRIEMF